MTQPKISKQRLKLLVAKWPKRSCFSKGGRCSLKIVTVRRGEHEKNGKSRAA